MLTIFQIFFLILLADFIIGHVHWWEDAMGIYLNPILNKIKYWEFLEWIISLFGIKVVRGSSIRKGL